MSGRTGSPTRARRDVRELEPHSTPGLDGNPTAPWVLTGTCPSPERLSRGQGKVQSTLRPFGTERDGSIGVGSINRRSRGEDSGPPSIEEGEVTRGLTPQERVITILPSSSRIKRLLLFGCSGPTSVPQRPSVPSGPDENRCVLTLEATTTPGRR